MEKQELVKTTVDLPRPLFERLQRNARFKGEFTHIIRTGIEKELDERERRDLPSSETQPTELAS